MHFSQQENLNVFIAEHVKIPTNFILTLFDILMKTIFANQKSNKYNLYTKHIREFGISLS